MSKIEFSVANAVDQLFAHFYKLFRQAQIGGRDIGGAIGKGIDDIFNASIRTRMHDDNAGC